MNQGRSFLFALWTVLTPIIASAQSEGCNFAPTIACGPNGGCDKLPKEIATFIGIVQLKQQTFRVCFGEKCIDAVPTIRRSNEGDYLAVAILQNPRNLASLGKKFFATFAYSAASNIPSRGAIYSFSENGGPTLYLSSSECSGAG